MNFDFQTINKTLFLYKLCNNECSLYKMWWLCSSIHNDIYHKIYNRNIIDINEITLYRLCENRDICPYNIHNKSACSSYCQINEIRFILTDDYKIRQFYNPFEKKYINITEHVCASYSCNTFKFTINHKLLLDEIYIDNDDLLFIIDNNKIIKYLKYT